MQVSFRNLQVLVFSAAMFPFCSSYAASLRAQVVDTAGNPYAEAVVSLQPSTPVEFAVPATAVMDQRGKQFDPHVLVVRKNTSVRFPNSDDIRHQVYSFSPAKRFELRLYHGQQAKPVLFDTAGEVVLGCNIHDQMVGYIYVVDTPWFGRSDQHGEVHIADVPPGRYTAKLWYPGVAANAEGLEQGVSVTAAGDTTLKFKVETPTPVAAPASDLQQLFTRPKSDAP
jgi:plastocyanin